MSFIESTPLMWVILPETSSSTGDADARAVAVLEHFRYDRHRFLLRVGELRQGSDLLAQQLGGVDRAFRFSRVGGLAGGSQLDAALDRLYMVNAVVVVAKIRLRDALQGPR